MKNKEDIILIGGGGHCKSVVDVILSTEKYNIAGIIDLKENIGKQVLDYKIIGFDDDLIDIFKNIKNAVISIGHILSNSARVKSYNHLKSIGFNLPIIIASTAYVSKFAQIGEGTVIMHQAVVNADAKIGINCIINTKALVEHDAIVGNHCHISTGSIVNGGAIVQDNSFIGSNSTTIQYRKYSGFHQAGKLHKGNIE
ncbi:MAG TPA: hypothetical protein PLI27_10950 [Ignavibacteriales bacterium]|nr:hypothetical protein [Ignavibacteriales bacterium]HOL81776.1 hypothetical protein [Ignavibacteriales bacterium]HOM65852.1 hypothetical protein [Ignavibacteriales bacterium]HPD68575.1 hypothetical protein [Ignavibacteriales bacterium]HPP33912.1 hypothetical protein [Ignavibacteriales bacterium]